MSDAGIGDTKKNISFALSFETLYRFKMINKNPVMIFSNVTLLMRHPL